MALYYYLLYENQGELYNYITVTKPWKRKQFLLAFSIAALDKNKFHVNLCLLETWVISTNGRSRIQFSSGEGTAEFYSQRKKERNEETELYFISKV